MTSEGRPDPRDEDVLIEVAYRMQSDWPGDDVSRRAVLTAAMVARQRAESAPVRERSQQVSGNDGGAR